MASVVANGQVTISATVDGKTGYALLTSATGAAPVTLWDPEVSNTGNALKAVWGTSAANIFAVGGTGGAATIQRFEPDGSRTVVAPISPSAAEVWSDIWRSINSMRPFSWIVLNPARV